MLRIFAIMIVGMIFGWMLRNRSISRGRVSVAVSVVIMVMMLLIGIEMGGSDSVLAAFRSIFTDALLLTLGAVGGTIIAAWAVNRFIVKSKRDPQQSKVQNNGNWFSLMIVGVFTLGVVLGYSGVIPFVIDRASMWALYLLMALVGFGIGSDVEVLKALKSQPWRVIFLPIATIVGTYLGVLAMSPFVGLKITDQLAVGSGFGYYSLSSVLLSELRSAEIGAIALMVNVMRELITVVAAPFFARYFSPLAVICSGGATTIDVTLPVIIRTCGGSFVGMAIFQGVVVDLSVPFLVTFFASLS